MDDCILKWQKLHIFFPCQKLEVTISSELQNCQTVHSPLFFRKIVEIEGFALRAAILHECQYLRGGGLFGLLSFSRPLPLELYSATPAPSVHLKIMMAVITVRRAISQRSHEKIGDCEQSTKLPALSIFTPTIRRCHK